MLLGGGDSAVGVYLTRDDRGRVAPTRCIFKPIVVSEFRKAATQYPIVFCKKPETGRFAPMF